MLITFKTSAYANITMLGSIGARMLELMSYGTTVPGAVNAEDVPLALDNLKQAIDRIPEQVEPGDETEDDQTAVSLHTRAIPLLELLQAAVDEETYVRWE